MKKEKKKKRTQALSCEECGARCCRYTATEIDRPTCKRDYDNIRWYLLHDNVNVFVERGKTWHIEFHTDCSGLDAEGRCGIYTDRPKLCASYGEDGYDCEFHGNNPPYKRIFRTAEEFEKYLRKKGIKWRWRR